LINRYVHDEVLMCISCLLVKMAAIC